MHRFRNGLGLAVLCLLSACGGGGDGATEGGGTGGGGTPPPPANRAPIFSSAIIATAPENGTGTVYQAVASDPDGDAVTYSIAGGADASRFAITPTGQLSFVTPPDYDRPADANGDNIYEVRIGANDGKTTTELALAVTVTNDKEGVAVHRIATGFVDPVGIAPIDDQTIYVAEKKGAIWNLNPQTGRKTLVVQLADVTDPGVLAITAGLEFYPINGTYRYAFYILQLSRAGLVLRKDPSGLPGLDGGPTLAAGAQYPGGGWLGIDATGGPVIGISGTADDAQNDATNRGKILRLGPPFADSTAFPCGVCRQLVVAAKGLHKITGAGFLGDNLLIADSGEDTAEEVDFLPVGNGVVNFGWPYREGTQAVRDGATAGAVDPVIAYPHSLGKAIIGGAAGPDAIASLRGQYVFGDGSGAIFTVPIASIAQGKTLGADAFSRRTEDFAPDAGTIDHPVAIVAGGTRYIDVGPHPAPPPPTPAGASPLYILDADGEVFRVDAG